MEKAALSLIVSVVSPVITRLGDLTESYFGGDITQTEIDQLKCVNIPHILTVIQAAENIKSEILKPWLMRLKEIAYEAEDLLDIYEYKRMEDEISSSPYVVKMLKTKAKELLSPILPKTALKTSFEKMQQSADEAKRLSELLQLVSINSTIQTGSVVNKQSTTVSGMSSTVFGRDKERDYLINLLIHKRNESTSSNSSSRKRIPVYSLYGIGGAGKTTLAQYIYDDERVKSHFDERIWIEVTHNFNAEKITREIIHSINGNAPPSSCETLNLLQNNLKQILPAKNLLLVLDNIWCEEKELWDKLLIPFNEAGQYGCKILITTRSEEVGLTLNVNNNIPLKELKDDHCWSILMDHAFDHSKKPIIDPELAAIAKKIIEKLKKSPLALRIVGSLLGKKIDAKEWKQILKQDMLRETGDVIYSSFQNLPMHLQRCFAYCSLYPKGFRFTHGRVKYLVRQWIAVGFVEPLNESVLTLEELGMKYFDALVSYSFFQKSPFELLPQYKIHDLLHDLAEMVSKDSCFRIESEEQLCIPTTIKHLSIATYKEVIVRICDILNLVNLRTFMVHSISDIDCKIIVEEFDEVCKKLTKLRVLHFFECVKMRGLNSIGKFKLLRYLELHHVKELPESLGKLYHLQYLNLGQPGLFIIPKSFRNLVNLRRFTGFESRFPDLVHRRRFYGSDTESSKNVNIAKLILLEELNDFYPQKSEEYGMKQLKNLQQLHGSLTINNIENVSNEVDAIEARLNRKSYLSELGLEWDKDQKTKVSSNTCEEVFERS